MMDSKYLSYVTPQQRGNYTALIPGLLDVIISPIDNNCDQLK
jgi:hypothetical protein